MVKRRLDNERSIEDYSHEELIQECKRLRQHVYQLRAVISKREVTGYVDKPLGKDFDMSACQRRHIFLRIAYLGWKHDGYVVQEDTPNTVENILFGALIHTRLIERRETSNYHRCGRTDKGVSAACQIISIDVRCISDKTNEAREHPNLTSTYTSEKLQNDGDKEIDYVHILNSSLPASVRALCWSAVPDNASARFDCTQRVYHYYFLGDGLNIRSMEKAASVLIGEHDFRNFCKMDVRGGVTTFTRRIDSIDFMLCSKEDGDHHLWMKCVIAGSSFLWHQIRCIMTILFTVGLGLEDESVVDYLLDIVKCPSRPHYTLANETPLVLHNCEYNGLSLDWIGPGNSKNQTSEDILACLRKSWSDESVKGLIVGGILSEQQNMPNRLNYSKTISNSVWPYFVATPGPVHTPIALRHRAITNQKMQVNQSRMP